MNSMMADSAHLCPSFTFVAASLGLWHDKVHRTHTLKTLLRVAGN